jgi:hypothetical protein
LQFQEFFNQPFITDIKIIGFPIDEQVVSGQGVTVTDPMVIDLMQRGELEKVLTLGSAQGAPSIEPGQFISCMVPVETNVAGVAVVSESFC